LSHAHIKNQLCKNMKPKYLVVLEIKTPITLLFIYEQITTGNMSYRSWLLCHRSPSARWCLDVMLRITRYFHSTDLAICKYWVSNHENKSVYNLKVKKLITTIEHSALEGSRTSLYGKTIRTRRTYATNGIDKVESSVLEYRNP
jgi:hypothetical protein